MEKVVASAPDPWFFYALTLLLIGVIVWVIVRYINTSEQAVRELRKEYQELRDMAKNNHIMLLNHQEIFKEIKEELKEIHQMFVKMAK